MLLDLETALRLVHAALEAGRKAGLPIAVVVSDRGGRILASARAADVGHVNLDVAQRKANTAVNFKAPTHALLDALRADSVALAAVTSEPSLCVLPGGAPITLQGELVGGLGVAGAHYSQDREICEAALTAL